MTHKIDIQRGSYSGFDVLVNGDHYMSYRTHEEAVTGAMQAANEGRTEGVIIRDFTRPEAGMKYAVIASW